MQSRVLAYEKTFVVRRGVLRRMCVCVCVYDSKPSGTRHVRCGAEKLVAGLTRANLDLDLDLVLLK